MSKLKIYAGVGAIALASSFLLISCATKTPSADMIASSSNPDAATDEALGALPEEGQTEAEKVVGVPEEESQTDKALQELQRMEREEHERRIHRAVTEDRIVAGQG